MVEASWDDIDATRWERLPFTFALGFPYVQYINHSGWVYKYTFSKNVAGDFLVMDVQRVFDQETVFHGRLNPYDIVKAKDPVTKRRRFLWFCFQLDFVNQDVVIYVFHIPEWVK